ncbi:hypothetical protein D3C77_610520 [compost metagenome]
MLLAVEPGRKPGQKDEYRRTQGAEQAGEKQLRGNAQGIHRITDLTVQEEGFANVVEQHQQHDQAAQGIDRLQTGVIRGHGQLTTIHYDIM